MFDIGFWELFLIAVVALVVVGPERLPKLVRVTGLWIGRANASIQSIRNEISQELRAEELKQALNKTVDLDEIASIGSNSIAPKETAALSTESDPTETPREAAKANDIEKDKNDNG
jgi:sec-independent protein translocase protein TatB